MNNNTEFELFTQRVYQKLVNNDVLRPTLVQHDVKLKGKSGCEHQIDVYWEYEIAGNKHCVAIECKNYNAHVPIGKVRDFFGVLHDLNNVQGIMVSSKGFQEGAKQYARHYGISLKELRQPRRNDIIGTIISRITDDMVHTLYLIDEEWVKEHNFNLDNLRKFYASFQSDKEDYWLTATHLPIETKDNVIRNAKGKRITTIDALRKKLPNNPEPGTDVVFSFDDGWLESRYWGPVKIREVKFEFEREVHETTINLAAEGFVEAILEDALGGKTEYVPKY